MVGRRRTSGLVHLRRRGKPLSVDPGNAEYREVLVEDVTRLLSPSGYDLDGFFLDFTARQALPKALAEGHKTGIELLHDYVALVHGAAKAAKPDAMIMTHCPHPYFADVTDVLRLNDWALKRPNIIEQATYRHQIAVVVFGLAYKYGQLAVVRCRPVA